MVQQRFNLRQEMDGTWTVFEVSTGQPADAWGRPAKGLDKGYADDLVDLLNIFDTKRRITRGNID
ncbi:MAG: hypothetical protein E5W90_26435 [Mesorhizobium sp.]|nr:MAG: hypothetical protein E5W90_26435 [Mesorhizobium sp.]